METRTPIIDLHGHFPMQLPIPVRPCDDQEQTRRNQGLMDTANRFANFQFPFLPFPIPRYLLSDAKSAGVNFGSVLCQPADEVFGPCGGFQNLSNQITE
jgi:hypothetical protein